VNGNEFILVDLTTVELCEGDVVILHDVGRVYMSPSSSHSIPNYSCTDIVFAFHYRVVSEMEKRARQQLESWIDRVKEADELDSDTYWIALVAEARELSAQLLEWSIEAVKQAGSIFDPCARVRHQLEILAASEALRRFQTEYDSAQEERSYIPKHPLGVKNRVSDVGF